MAEQFDSTPVAFADVDLNPQEAGWTPLQTSSLAVLLILCAVLVWNAYNPADLYFSDLDFTTVKADQGVALSNISLLGRTIQIGGSSYGKGLSVFGNSEIALRIPEGYAFFLTEVGIDQNTPEENGSVVFSIISDGAVLYESPIVRKGMEPLLVSVPVKFRKIITLRVSDAGDGNSGDYADWADARFVYSM